MRYAIAVLALVAGIGAACAQTTTPAPATATTPAAATPPTCNAQAAEKKLAGAAKNSFLTKCEKDATTACNTKATEQKLNGAAKTSFTKKCVTDAVGKAA